jgi:hypothetical protein
MAWTQTEVKRTAGWPKRRRFRLLKNEAAADDETKNNFYLIFKINNQ